MPSRSKSNNSRVPSSTGRSRPCNSLASYGSAKHGQRFAVAGSKSIGHMQSNVRRWRPRCSMARSSVPDQVHSNWSSCSPKARPRCRSRHGAMVRVPSSENDWATSAMANKAADTRRLAIDALVRIDADGAYANIVLPAMLQRSRLDSRDRAFATELVYGTTRMRRACDWLVDRFLMSPVEPVVRAALRVGAYQLVFVEVPAHAAVNTTVSAAPARA